MNKLILDGDNIFNKEQLHKVLKEKMDLPDYYGENSDALWDCLTGWVDLPLKITWKNYNKSKEILGNYAERLLQLFKEGYPVN
ncbi:MAG: barstar family protein, partial [Thermoactinomyces sp.]